MEGSTTTNTIIPSTTTISCTPPAPEGNMEVPTMHYHHHPNASITTTTTVTILNATTPIPKPLYKRGTPRPPQHHRHHPHED
ncbi:unnamed protein product, partial [Nesidiocoris tenuis]